MSSLGWLVLQIIVAIIVMVMIGSVLVEIAFGIDCWRLLEAWRLMGDAPPHALSLHQRAARRVPTAAGHAHDHLTRSRRHVS